MDSLRSNKKAVGHSLEDAPLLFYRRRAGQTVIVAPPDDENAR